MSNQSKTLNEIRELAERLFPAETSSLVGASDRLIALLEELFDLQFPTVYQEYLRWSGNTASFFCSAGAVEAVRDHGSCHAKTESGFESNRGHDVPV